ncbi:MAG TPA: ABC transporter substrate-binding protein [Caldisericia bacterium]|nr:ABC transporter substrate-binding protein [Caldisericia bacterium]HPF48508.1 ABC transporter substrate-binding protein [Caldisericia bacterium]HPI83311.1 ABC transporter substrate-binding protein [Caldisericia bacterium]HPQ92963.1 ABC transporter substrate-binding protein [Caldisericia bacterium]HRV75203.1 ABC transporter substrate-binding protein [Caldisericia bacterium]
MKRFLSFVLVGLLFLTLFAACGVDEPAPQEKVDVNELPLLRVGHVNQDHHLALYVAALKGEGFKDSGVWLTETKPKELYVLHTENGGPIAQVQLVKSKGGAEMTNNLLADLFDVGFGGVPAVMGVVDKGKNVRILMPLQNSGDQLVVKNEMPVENWNEFVEFVKNSTEQIKLGYKAPTAVQYIIAQKAFIEVGITQTEDPTNTDAMVLWINQKGQDNMTTNLAAGLIDGFVANQPTPAQAIVEGVAKFITELSVLPPEGMWENHPCCMVCSTTGFVDGNRAYVKEFLRLIMNATDYINANPVDAVAVAYEFLGLKEGVEDMSIPTIIYHNTPSETWRDGVATWAEVMNEMGKYSGELKGVTDEKAVDMCVDFSIYEELLKEQK